MFKEIRRLFVETAAKHKELKGYRLKFRYMYWGGQCNVKAKLITINSLLVKYATWETVSDVLLHEIAHVIANKMNPKVHRLYPHGRIFCEAAELVGAKPKVQSDVMFQNNIAAMTFEMEAIERGIYSQDQIEHLKNKSLLELLNNPQ